MTDRAPDSAMRELGANLTPVLMKVPPETEAPALNERVGGRVI